MCPLSIKGRRNFTAAEKSGKKFDGEKEESSLWRPKERKWKDGRVDLSKWEDILWRKKGRVLNRVRKTGCGGTRTETQLRNLQEDRPSREDYMITRVFCCGLTYDIFFTLVFWGFFNIYIAVKEMGSVVRMQR